MKKIFVVVCLVVVGLMVIGCQSPTTPSITDDGGSSAIIFKAASAEPPSNPEVNWAYYNTTDKTWYIWDGSSWLVLAIKGDTGAKGADGSVVTIGSNGNWFINGSDTGISALGEKGESGGKGDQGEKGEPGQDYTLNNKLLVQWSQGIEYEVNDTHSNDTFINLVTATAEAFDGLAETVFSSMGYDWKTKSGFATDLPEGISTCCFDVLSDQPSGYLYHIFIIVPEITYGIGGRAISDTIEYEVPGFYQGYSIEVWRKSNTTYFSYGRKYSLSKK